jgi:excinuclease ABC subunit C
MPATEDRSPILEALKAKVDNFPRLPGVYLMKDANSTVIYVGKARDLRSRVRNYFMGQDTRSQIEFLLRKVSHVEKIVTESEEQAFILERDLITKYKPRYNIRLKDDKAYLSVRIDQNRDWPRLELVRRVENDGARYFGPYTSSYELRKLLEVIKKVVPLRSCADTVFFNRQRPCLEYQIKRCLAPCCLEIARNDYAELVKQAIALLEGKNDSLLRELTARMDELSGELRFEEAAALRDRIAILETSRKSRPLMSHNGESRDAFALYREVRYCVVSVLRARHGRISDNINFPLTDVNISDEEVIESAIGQFYENHDIPEEVLLPAELQNQDILRKILSEKRGSAVEMVVPKKGSKSRLLALASLNARQHFISNFESEDRYMAIAEELATLARLKQMPRRIECLDISNFQASDIVGATVAFADGVPDKRAYRKYKLSRQDKPDDFASVLEVLSRRLKRGAEEENLPDLIIIDGGPGQLAKAWEARAALEIPIEIISLAKMRTESDVHSKEVHKSSERIYVTPHDEPILLTPGSALTNFISKVRDEAHRYVISFHRQSRKKRVIKSALDDIGGIGPDRRQRLLKYFGSVAKIAEASAEEVAKAGRMSKLLAEKVLREIKQQ